MGERRRSTARGGRGEGRGGKGRSGPRAKWSGKISMARSHTKTQLEGPSELPEAKDKGEGSRAAFSFLSFRRHLNSPETHSSLGSLAIERCCKRFNCDPTHQRERIDRRSCYDRTKERKTVSADPRIGRINEQRPVIGSDRIGIAPKGGAVTQHLARARQPGGRHFIRTIGSRRKLLLLYRSLSRHLLPGRGEDPNCRAKERERGDRDYERQDAGRER